MRGNPKISSQFRTNLQSPRRIFVSFGNLFIKTKLEVRVKYLFLVQHPIGQN